MLTKKEALQKIEELKQYVDGLDKKHVFKEGDIALCQGSATMSGIRIIVCENGRLVSINTEYLNACSTGQESFEHYNYVYVGKISDFINEETVEEALINAEGE